METTCVKNNFKNKIADYIRSGETDSENLGLEIEHFIIDKDGYQISFDQITGLIEEVTGKIGAKLVYMDGYPVGYFTDEYGTSLEPSCQFEISINPYSDIDKIGRIYKEFIDLWEPIFSDLGYKLEKKGNLPLVELGAITPADIPLSHKKRYKYMDTYFKNSGRYGSYMMRASASTQVSIDYKNEKDMVRKLRILEKISPILMIIMESKTKEDSNLPGITGKPHLHRIQEWDDLDDARTGFLKGSLDEDFNYDKMADIILNTPLILFSKDGNTIDVGSKSAADLVKENIIDVTADSESIKNDIEHVMSMGFFHFRVKKYIEIRVADSVEINKALGYVALIKGLFYDDSNLFALDEKLYNIKTIDEINSAVEEIKKDGLDAVIYKGYTARKWRNILKEIAINSLPENEKRYLEYI